MALIQELQAVTDDYVFNRTPEDIYFRDHVLIWKLAKKGKFHRKDRGEATTLNPCRKTARVVPRKG